MRPRLCELIGCLHTQQGIGLHPEGLLEADRHIGRETGIAVEQRAQCLPRNTEVCSEIGYADTGRLDNLALQPLADMDRNGADCGPSAPKFNSHQGGRRFRVGMHMPH